MDPTAAQGHDSLASEVGHGWLGTGSARELAALKELAGNKHRFLTILVPFRPARVLAPEVPLWQEPAA
jgi:hypothetical protein